MLNVEDTGITLAALAAVRAGLAEGFKREDVLRAEGIDPRTWATAEERWTQRLEADVDGALQEDYDAELARAQDRYGRRVPPLDEDLRAWLDFIRRWSADPAPTAFLARLGLRPTDVIRLQRSWTSRIAQDPALATEVNVILSREPGELPAIAPEPSRLPPPPAGRVPIAQRQTDGVPARHDADGEQREALVASEPSPAAVAFAPLPNEAADLERQAKVAQNPRAPHVGASPASPEPSAAPMIPLAAAPAPPPSFMGPPASASLAPGSGMPAPVPTNSGGMFGATEDVPADLLARVLQKGAMPFSAGAAPTPGSAASAGGAPARSPPPVASAGPIAGIGTTGELPPDLLQRVAKGPTPFVQSPPAAAPAPRKPDEDSITLDAEPNPAGAAEPLPFGAKQRPSSETTALPAMTMDIPRDLVASIAKGPLPFQPKATRAPDGEEPGSTGPLPADLVARIAKGPLPFAGAAPRTPPQSSQQPRGASEYGAAKDSSERALDAGPSPSKAAMPFKTPKRKDRGTAAMPAVPAADPTLPFSAPGKAASSASPSPQTSLLTLEQHASLTAELAVFHDNTDAVLAKYGLTDIRQRLAADQSWRERLRKNPDEHARWQRLHQHYRQLWTAQATKDRGA